MGMRCFCAPAQKQVDKCELYLAISSLFMHVRYYYYVKVVFLHSIGILNNCTVAIKYNFPLINNYYTDLNK